MIETSWSWSLVLMGTVLLMIALARGIAKSRRRQEDPEQTYRDREDFRKVA